MRESGCPVVFGGTGRGRKVRDVLQGIPGVGGAGGAAGAGREILHLTSELNDHHNLLSSIIKSNRKPKGGTCR